MFKKIVLALVLIISGNVITKCLETDYIVVGVGTAGATAAKILSDDKITSVVALHDGKNLTQNPLIKLSKNAIITVVSALINSPFYLRGRTTPQQFADFDKLLWVIANPEGGASSINAGAWCRGTTQFYDKWATIAGPLWSSKHVMQIYKELEHYHGQTSNPEARGFHGPISVVQFPQPTIVSQKFTQAIINATGFPFVLDYNNPQTPIGVSSQLQYTQSGPEGKFRVSSATAFLNKNVMTPDGYGVNGRHLRVLFNANALKVLWRANKAIGVLYLHNGVEKKVFARKGVVVCAGLKSSPFLLHSGIGPKQLLQSLKIPVIFDNPNVGRHLSDQPHIITLFSSNPADTQFPPADPNGPFSQISWLPDPIGNQRIRAWRLSTANTIPGITLALVDLVQPKSRGTVSINSNDPAQKPVINLGVLSNNDDLELFKRGFKTYMKNIDAALQAIDPTYQLIFPNPALFDDDVELTRFIRQNVESNMHFQSHCKMAPLNKGGVVNNKGFVHGVRNLIVADNSVCPLPMDGSPMATAYLVAANICRMLAQDLHLPA